MIGFTTEAHTMDAGTSTGISHWVSLPSKFFSYTLEQHVIVQLMILAPFITFFAFVSFVETAVLKSRLLTSIVLCQFMSAACWLGVVATVLPLLLVTTQKENSSFLFRLPALPNDSSRNDSMTATFSTH